MPSKVRGERSKPTVSPDEDRPRMPVVTDDGYTFWVDVDTLKVSSVLRVAIEGGFKYDDNEKLLIPGMSHDTLQRVLWWMESHKEDKDLKEDTPIDETLDAWQRCFFSCTTDILVKLISASNYLNVRRLMVLGITKLAQVINLKMSDENPVRAIRDSFHMKAPKHSRSQPLNEDVSRMFIFDGNVRSDESSKIDVLDVEVTHLPPRRLEPPEIRDKD